MKLTKEVTAKHGAQLQRLRNLPEFQVLLEWLEARAKDHAHTTVYCQQPTLMHVSQGRAQEAESILQDLKDLSK